MRLKLLEIRSLVRCALQESDAHVDMQQFYPDDHVLGMRVPKGGSACSKCKFVSNDGTSCGNEGFRAWHSEVGHAKEPKKLPAPADEYCCDLFETAKD